MAVVLKCMFIILLLEGIDFYLMIEEWTPTAEIIFRLIVFISQFYIFYLIYKVIKTLNAMFKKRYSKKVAISYISFVGALFAALFASVNFVYILILVFSPPLIDKKTIGNRAFYIYDYSFKDTMSGVFTSEYLIMRKKLIILGDYNISLYQKDNKVILKTHSRGDIDIYDLNSSKKLYIGE